MAFEARGVILHVYDLHKANSWLSPVGMGIHHSGVEIAGREYTYCVDGIFSHAPKGAVSLGKSDGTVCLYKCSIPMGVFEGTFNHVHSIVKQLRRTEFQPGSYNLSTKNCNHFCEAFIRELTGIPLPPWINRAAYFGSLVVKPLSCNFDQHISPTASMPSPRKKDVRPKLTEKQRELLAKLGKK